MKNEKKTIVRSIMPEQEAKFRIKNFKEVPLGYTQNMAYAEAKRCLLCKKPNCIKGCPVDVDIPYFIRLITEGKFHAAAHKIKEKNYLPAICGRVCPQEDQCEKYCILTKKSQSIAIGSLERFVADYEYSNNKQEETTSFINIIKKNNKKIAIVGSGPAGLTVAGDLIQLGYNVTVFEALHKAGGVLTYGIPEFRLPKSIVELEINYLKKLGVKFIFNVVIGKIKTIDDLFRDGFNAIFIGVGAGSPIFMNIPGENLNGIYSANEYLTRSNLMKAYKYPHFKTPIIKGKNVAVIGGGNVAIDSVRTALRLGADNAYIIYRRTEIEMPARKEEMHHALEEGVKFKFLHNPIIYIGDDKYWVKKIRCLKMKLSEPDKSGRLKPIPIAGSELDINVDTVIVAVGTTVNPIITNNSGINLTQFGYIMTQNSNGITNRVGVYAGGDIVTGSATVILAMGAGRKSAQAIHQYLQEK